MNRRSFFSGLAGLLAHVPILGVWLSRNKSELEEWGPRSGSGYVLKTGTTATCYFELIEWIPVSERLPDEKTICVLTAQKSGWVCFTTRMPHRSGQPWAQMCGGITHWAELPAPPGKAND